MKTVYICKLENGFIISDSHPMYNGKTGRELVALDYKGVNKIVFELLEEYEAEKSKNKDRDE